MYRASGRHGLRFWQRREPLNQQWYDKLIRNGKGFKPLYLKAGLEQCIDLQIVQQQGWLPQDKHAAILEIGPGDGRVIDYLRKLGYDNITAVENHPKIFKVLKQKYADDTGVKLILSDIRNYQPSTLFSTALWLWCGIDEIPKEQQGSAIQHMMSMVLANGVFVYDTPTKDGESNVTITHEKSHRNGTYNAELQNDDTVFRAYLPTRDELQQTLATLKEQGTLANYKILSYQTATSRERVLSACFPGPQLRSSLRARREGPGARL
ncbi:MAG: hypothetical protein CMF50_08035 [Legionellales bacterium]|nr:hypothetical protein [Legionellales bacterium]|tara:strand:+ start:8624 stop:9418 length:795 start_codon:yes stop_codon:yes gene_type:complete